MFWGSNPHHPTSDLGFCCAGGMKSELSKLRLLPGLDACATAIRTRFSQSLNEACENFLGNDAGPTSLDDEAFRQVLRGLIATDMVHVQAGSSTPARYRRP